MALNQKNGINTGRVLWYDPNPNDNVPINVEDLNISVSLEATSKNKSVIINNNNGTVVNNSNNNNNNKTIKFIRSSAEDKYPNAPITTSYSEIEHILNNSADFSGRYYESIGIESINIEFNTSYAPMIKIKMIDVRGSSIFSSNGKGDYNFFFELPYPLFNLEIKGFYGRPVNYCLHLIRFNASFNSQTGNFEIDCDFIGYTYALLNDMLMSLLRGVQDTTLGNKIFNEIKAEYKPELQPEIIKINELINKVNEGKYILNTNIGRNPAKEKEIAELNTIKTNLKVLIGNINGLIDKIANIMSTYYVSPTYSYTIFNYDSGLIDNVVNIDIKEFEDNQKKLLTEIEALPKYTTLNSQLTQDNVVSKYSALDNNISCSITLDDINDDRDVVYNPAATSLTINPFYAKLINNICYKYPDTEINHINSLLVICKNLSDNIKIGVSDNVSIIDFTYTHKLINDEIIKIDTKIKKLEDEISAEVNAALNSKTSRPTATVRNLFRVLTTGVDNFLKTLHSVSVDASTSAERQSEMNKLIGDKDSINYDETDSTVSPWPEYRENRDETYYKETYLGTVLDSAKVPELKFTEELVSTMIKQKKEESVSVSVSSANSELPNSWYPLTVLDNGSFSTRNDNKKMRGNPYFIHVNEGFSKPEDMIKVFVLRMFLLLGFCHRNRIQDWLIKFHAELEAHNLYYVLNKLRSGKDVLIVEKIKNLDFNGLLTEFGSGSSGTGMFEDASTYLNYTYIRDKDGEPAEAGHRAYLPVNNNFDKGQWYSGGKLKNSGAIRDLIANKSIITATNINNYVLFETSARTTIKQDGLDEQPNCDYFDIIPENVFKNTNFSPPTVLTSSQGLLGLGIGADQTPYENGTDVLYDPYKESIFYKNPLSIYGGKSTYGYINTYLYASSSGKISREVFFTPSNYFNSEYVGISNFIVHNNNVNTKDRTFNSVKLYEIKQNTFTTSVGIPVNDYQQLSMDNDEFNQVFKKAFQGNDTNKNYRAIAMGTSKIEDYNIPFIGFGHLNKINGSYEITRFSLFGSRLYYSQKDNYSKAFLFLHTFPFQGLASNETSGFVSMFDLGASQENFDLSFKLNDVQNNNLKQLFRLHNGMIKAPKIWVLFIGALFWRASKGSDPIINPTDAQNNEIYAIPNMKAFMFTKKYQTGFLGMLLHEKDIDSDYDYKYIDNTLLGLPKSVKDKFINEFTNWVNGEFSYYREQLEIKDSNGKLMDNPSEALDVLKNIFTNILNYKTNDYNSGVPGKYVKFSNLENDEYIKHIYKNYCHFSPQLYSRSTSATDTQNTENTQLNLILRPNTEINKKILTLMIEPIYIQNSNPWIWNPINLYYYENTNTDKLDKYHNVNIFKEDGKTFYDAFREKFKALTNGYTANSNAADAAIKKSLFGTENEETIRLNIYRTLMAIYEKWISGVDNDRFFAQCSYNDAHDKIAYEERNVTTTPRLIDSFRFVDRAFRDISNKLYVNPKTFTEIIKNNSNATFFDVANKVLNDNNFVFVPLPTFFNFNKIEELEESFRPLPNNDHSNVVSGPSFVCVYAGQVSNHLDLKYENNDANYPDDGIFITSDDKNIFGLPSDFTDGTPNAYEMNVPIFSVNYGQQNQNYFKDIKLDQKEFTETAESLEIINDLSNQGDKTKETYVGQNLFNVYQKRSYSCEVEMLGNALIQPMMYFQLNNIPMFRGMYLIINVKHSIKPNQMTTTFKGVRVKKYKTPLLQTNEVFSSVNAGPSSSSSSNNSNTNRSTNNSIEGLEGYNFDVGTTESNLCAEFEGKTYLTPAQKLFNQQEIIKFLKKVGLNKNQVAGAMGNMDHESAFNHNAANLRDVNGATDYGIIQYNSYNFTDKPDCMLGARDWKKSVGCVRCIIGETVEKQLKYVVNNNNNFKTYLKYSEPKHDAWDAGYWFARLVEICTGCGLDKNVYATNTITLSNGTVIRPYERSNKAVKYKQRFDDPADDLYWDKF